MRFPDNNNNKNDNPASIALAVDIGSTRTRLAAVDLSALSCACRIDFANAEFDVRFAASVRAAVSSNPLIRRVDIASCVKKLAVKAKNICENEIQADKHESLFDNVEIIEVRDGLAVTVNYDDPRKLGADRFCNALACAMLFGDRSCVIIDVGTAVTVDCLRGGRIFEGGAILPGVFMQTAALHRGTDALPLVGPEGFAAAPSVVGASTAGCVAAGTLYGVAGAVDRLAAEYSDILRVGGGGEALIIATGGGWEALRPLVRFEAEFIQNLTLMGVAAAGVKKN